MNSFKLLGEQKKIINKCFCGEYWTATANQNDIHSKMAKQYVKHKEAIAYSLDYVDNCHL